MSYSQDTEVKTDHGWKLIKDIDLEHDQILSLDPYRKEISYAKVLVVDSKDYKGKLCSFNLARLNLLVSPDHLLCASPHNWKRAESIDEKYDLLIQGFTFQGEHKDKFILPHAIHTDRYTHRQRAIQEKELNMDSFLDWFGLWLASGYWKRKGYICAITPRRDGENEQMIIDAFKNIGYDPHFCKAKNYSLKSVEVYDQQLYHYLQQFDKEKERFIPQEFLELDQPSLQRLLNSILQGRSHKDGTKRVISHKSRLFMDGLQELLLKAQGILWQVKPIVKKSRTNELAITKSIRKVSYCKPELMDYEGKLYDVKLDKNHVMLVRRNGVVCWSSSGMFPDEMKLALDEVG